MKAVADVHAQFIHHPDNCVASSELFQQLTSSHP